LYKEILEDSNIKFIPRIEKIGDLKGYFGHKSYNCLDKKDIETLRASEDVVKLLLNN